MYVKLVLMIYSSDDYGCKLSTKDINNSLRDNNILRPNWSS